jgi:transposase-like protein
MDDAEADVLAFMTFPKDHRPKIHSIKPLERLNVVSFAVPSVAFEREKSG